MSYFDEEYYEDLRYGDVDPDLATLNRELSDRRFYRMAKAREEPVSQQREVKLIRDYQGRVLKGWSVVEWNNQFFWPRKEAEEWIASNVVGEYTRCPIGSPRFFFKDEEDAVLCYLAFK